MVTWMHGTRLDHALRIWLLLSEMLLRNGRIGYRDVRVLHGAAMHHLGRGAGVFEFERS